MRNIDFVRAVVMEPEILAEWFLAEHKIINKINVNHLKSADYSMLLSSLSRNLCMEL
jgi:hypothetical protein